MKKQMTTLALALTIIFSNIGTVFAETEAAPKAPQGVHRAKPTPEQMEAFHQKMIEKLNEELDLTQDQIKKADEIRLKYQKKMKTLVEKQRKKFDEIRQIRQNDDILIKVQDEKIEKIKQELKVINQEIRQVKQDERKAFRAILTDEQKTKLDELKIKHHNRMMKKPKRHHRFDNSFSHHPKKVMETQN